MPKRKRLPQSASYWLYTLATTLIVVRYWHLCTTDGRWSTNVKMIFRDVNLCGNFRHKYYWKLSRQRLAAIISHLDRERTCQACATCRTPLQKGRLAHAGTWLCLHMIQLRDACAPPCKYRIDVCAVWECIGHGNALFRIVTKVCYWKQSPFGVCIRNQT